MPIDATELEISRSENYWKGKVHAWITDDERKVWLQREQLVFQILVAAQR